MRLLTQYIVLSFVIIVSCENYDVSEDQAEIFIKHYGIGMDDEGLKVYNTQDGYLIFGHIENPGRGKDICVFRTDKFGNTTFPVQVFGGLFDDYAYAITENSDGYIIAGSARTSEISDLNVYLLQINSSAELLWDTIYRAPNNNEAYDVIIRDNGNIVCTGYSEQDDNNSDILFLETTASGDSVITWNTSGTHVSEVAYSITSLNGIYLFAGYHIPANEGTSLPSLYLLKWKGKGVAIPQVGIRIGQSSVAQSIISDRHNGYYITCNVLPYDREGAEIYLLKVSENMEEIWRLQYGENLYNRVNGLMYYEDKILMCGTSSQKSGGGNMFVLSANRDGSNAQYLYSGDGVSYYCHGFDITPDGGFVLTGKTVLNEKSTIVLSKMNRNGGI